jgi:tetratricopeptide (TPR) repeat protein
VLRASVLLLSLAQGPFGPTDQADADAQALFRRADAAYQTSNYPTAIETYTEAFNVSQEIEDEALRKRVLQAIRFNLGRAHFKA